jgi:hypothetical protein
MCTVRARLNRTARACGSPYVVFRAHDNQYGNIYLADFRFGQSLPGAPNAGGKRLTVAFGCFREATEGTVRRVHETFDGRRLHRRGKC